MSGLKVGACAICEAPIPSGSRGVTCGRSCGSRLREARKVKEWRKPREYPAEIVELATSLYLGGAAIQEVQAALPPGNKAQRILDRHCPDNRRRCAKRNQRGEANDSWRGDAAGYAALHLRVASARGKPSFCERCGATEGKFEWANLTGNYVDVEDYARMCVSCHRRYDAARRRETGRRTMPEGM